MTSSPGFDRTALLKCAAARLRRAGIAAVIMLLAAGSMSGQSFAGLGSLGTLHPGVKSRRVSSFDRTGGNNDRFTDIAPGAKRVIASIPGAGIIKHLWFTMSPTPDKLSRNDIVLRMYWDGAERPSVEVPIGPFFGQGWNEAYEFISLPLSATALKGRSLVCYFPMPFAAGARIEIENQSATPINAFYFQIDYEELARLPADQGRFHAAYRYAVTSAPDIGENESGVLREAGKNVTGGQNFVIADIHGRGHFVGVNYYVNSPSPMWYGEGDDMITIDGDPQPTLNGTGTEDYFNTSWCPKEIVSHPYFGIARVNGETGWLGRTHLYRFHIADPILFERSLKFSIEHGHANGLTLELATVAYWYQDTAVGVPPVPAREARQPKPVISLRDIFRWRDAWRQREGNAPTLWGNEPNRPASSKTN